ncbi:MAG: hypothetical protein PUP90_18735 [Nostoc sp. S4]|nr:hypothetical protein [Nostoc sp. S4]
MNPDARLVYQKNFGQTPLGDIRLIDELPNMNFYELDFLVSLFLKLGTVIVLPFASCLPLHTAVRK